MTRAEKNRLRSLRIEARNERMAARNAVGINLELNVTLQCNLACPNCNRLCHVYRDRTEHMSVEQIVKFIAQAKNGGGINILKLLGGEPLMHPQFVDIYNLLVSAAKDGIIKIIKVGTNRTIPIPDVDPSSFVCWQGKSQSEKKHQPALWSPKDLNLESSVGKCLQLAMCGYSLDKYGYLPCSPGIMFVRLFGLTHLYKREFPTATWGLDSLCPNCIFSTTAEWRSQYSAKSLSQHTSEDLTPTKSFKEAMEKWNPEEFYKTQLEF